VEIIPNTDGLVHISELAHHRVKAVTDILKEGDELMVKVLEVDRQGKIRLSRKALIEPANAEEAEYSKSQEPRKKHDRVSKKHPS
jgi:polyribonucleotide nucleotidyltransferase